MFYPYYILSRPQAIKAMKWDWPILFSTCKTMLWTMPIKCNKYVEKAGLGEDIDPLKLIY